MTVVVVHSMSIQKPWAGKVVFIELVMGKHRFTRITSHHSAVLSLVWRSFFDRFLCVRICVMTCSDDATLGWSLIPILEAWRLDGAVLYRRCCIALWASRIANLIGFEGWRERNQQDATDLMFIIKLLSQHVSGIIMPIIRRTRVHCRIWCSAL